MNYTYSITTKGQVTIPQEFRHLLGIQKGGQATFSLNKQGEVVIGKPKTLAEVRTLLNKPSGYDVPSDKEKIIGRQLAKKYGVS